jgi:gamma-glutamylputrescine oxidase
VGRIGDNIYYPQGSSGQRGYSYPRNGKLIVTAFNGQATRFDAFAALLHYPFPWRHALRVPFSALGAWYYTLRDKFGIITISYQLAVND